MSTRRDFDRGGERGSAMVIAVLVMAILTLLGVSFLLMADTENKIAENERLGAQALYFGEGVTREAKRWFDRPPYSSIGNRNLVQPTTAVMVRTLRIIDIDGPGPTASVAADGSGANPYYKVGVDRDTDGNDDVFEKPYRTALRDMLVGTAAGPDIRIDRATDGATATFLDALAEKVMPGFPAAAAGIHARIKTIDVYAPPYIDTGGGNWARFGMATVSTRVQILRNPGLATEIIMADRTVAAVLNETPFPGPFGPLHSCEELIWTGEFSAHWGAATAVGPDGVNGDIDVANNWTTKLYHGIPRETPPTPRLDLLFGYDDITDWNTLVAGLEGDAIEDPWFQFFGGGPVVDWNALPSPQIVAPGTTAPDQSNLFQNMPNVTCPDFDYDTWKQIAQSGGSDVHYFAWDNGTQFRQNAVGAAADFVTLTDNRTGLYFFDTMDGLRPHSQNASGVAANLTPAIQLTGNDYGMRGFLYMNTKKWTSNGTPGDPITMHWPAEPFRDVNLNGAYDVGEEWINLNYNTISTTDPLADPVVSSADNYGGGALWNSRGPDITGQEAIIWGLLYLAGDFDAQGTPLYYGSVVTKSGNDNQMAGTPNLFWDTDLKENWPPVGWDLPRVIITRWQTDL